jgi:hypothetical protein
MQFLCYPCPHASPGIGERKWVRKCFLCLHVSVILSQICGYTTVGRYSLSGDKGGGVCFGAGASEQCGWSFLTLCGIHIAPFSMSLRETIRD